MKLGEADFVLAASFAAEEAPEEELESQRALKDKAEEWLARKSFLIAIAAHGAPAPVQETRSSGLVVGRSSTEVSA